MTRRALEFLVPGDLRAATGGYVYDRRMIAGLRALGWQVTVHTLEASFPEPTSAALAHAHRTLASLPAHALVLIDGLALSAMPEVLRAYCAQLEL
ncbi:MAG: glycosyltransferase family 4 protein, partial [Steroidobacteraceae bacterium]